MYSVVPPRDATIQHAELPPHKRRNNELRLSCLHRRNTGQRHLVLRLGSQELHWPTS